MGGRGTREGGGQLAAPFVVDEMLAIRRPLEAGVPVWRAESDSHANE